MKKLLPLMVILLLLLVSCDDSEHTCDFSEWHILEAPSCTAQGREYRSCKCGKTEIRPADTAPHNIISVEAKPASCTEGGYAAFKYCADCSYTTFAGEISPSHDIATVAAKSPTCTDSGYEAYEYCKSCEDYNTYAEIPARGHTFVSLECSMCTATLTAVTVPELAEDISDGISAAYYIAEGGLSLLDITGSGEIPAFDFSPFSNLSPTHLRIGDDITGIGENAFSGMSTIVSVTVGASVGYISDGAFSDCYRITEVINNSPLSISNDNTNGELGRFAICITTTVGTRVKFIGDFIFYIEGQSYTLVSYIGSDEHLVLPTLSEVSAYAVRNYAFYDLDFLLSAEWGEQVSYVGVYAFLGCDNLT